MDRISSLDRSGKRVSFGLWPSEGNLEDADDVVDGNYANVAAAGGYAAAGGVAALAAAAAAGGSSRRGSVDGRFRVGSTGSTGSAKWRKVRVLERLQQQRAAAADVAAAAAAAAGQASDATADSSAGAVVGGAAASFTLVSNSLSVYQRFGSKTSFSGNNDVSW